MSVLADPRATARFLGAFFSELIRWGVHDVVVSPGSRSTPLSMTAYEIECRFPAALRVTVDVDERGAAFVALGMAKATGRPAAAVCTSGTAVANYYPAVMEAESSRVPLLLLTGDRPPRLQGLGAPQTCDQLHAYGTHVRAFRSMPAPGDAPELLLFARQAAREACIAACGCAAPGTQPASARIAGACMGGPVQLNFPFDEPLKPDFAVWDEGGFSVDRGNVPRETYATASGQLCVDKAARIASDLRKHRTLMLAGEGACASDEEAHAVLAWAGALGAPVLADPLSGLRRFVDDVVIDAYDAVIERGGTAPAALVPERIVRFGRYPLSKKATQFAAAACAAGAAQLVVDPLETRDFNAETGCFIKMAPVDFARSVAQAAGRMPASDASHEFLDAWQTAAQRARAAAAQVDVEQDDAFEGSYVRRALELAPENSCVFAANSMAVRAVDTFLPRGARLTVLGNRGLNGIDGTVSTAVGAAHAFEQTTLITGDLTLQHDLNALSLQRELLRRARCESPARCMTIVLLNNNGGGIFDMLPQRSDEDYFERLFLTPQDVDFASAAAAFHVPYRRAATVAQFEEAYRACLGVPGISLVEVQVPLRGLPERYAPYWRAQ